jgi:hypothetical protein
VIFGKHPIFSGKVGVKFRKHLKISPKTAVDFPKKSDFFEKNSRNATKPLQNQDGLSVFVEELKKLCQQNSLFSDIL